jgi:hypothetical protein
MSALRLINETTGTSTSSFQVTDIFNSDFDIYKLTINNIDFANANYLRCRFINSSGSVVSATNYDWAFLDMTSNAAYVDTKNTNQNDIAIGYGGGTTTAWAAGFTMYVFNPFSSSSYTFMLSQSATNISASTFVGSKGISVLKQTASMKGIEFHLASSGVFDTIQLRTYGLRVDNG